MKLLIADDHTLVRDMLTQYVQRSDVNASITGLKDFYEVEEHLAQDSSYDLVLLDLCMPGMNGLKGLKVVRERFPDLKVGLISGLAEEQDVEEAISLGAAGYFPKTLAGKAMLSAIQLVLTGERFIPLDHKKNAVMPSHYADPGAINMNRKSALPGNGLKAESVGLTPREKDVLQFLVAGAANKEIARELDLQVVTVKLHVRGICKKLQAKNRTQAALKAKEIGLV